MIKKSLSVIIPCHNEEEVIIETYKILKNLIDKWSDIISSYEIIMVNNGSTDKTLEKMKTIYKMDDNVIILDLRNNFGFQGSITAGLYNAKNDMIITIDADLQDDPHAIKDMILKHYEGFDLVLGVRKSRDKDSFFKRHSAQLYYKFLNLIGIHHAIYNHGDFRLISRSLLEDFMLYQERNRYIRGIITNLESNYACVYYDRRERRKGKSKFNFSNLLSLAIDGITSFSAIPIRFISIFGIFTFILSIIGMLYIMYIKLVIGVDVPGWTFIVILIMLFGGINSLFIGIIGEYIGKTYIETKRRPIFIVRKKYARKK